MAGGISRLTALEIASNPGDLHFEILRKDGSDWHAIMVTRGPGHDLKMLVSSETVFLGREKAIWSIGALLRDIQLLVLGEFGPESDLYRGISGIVVWVISRLEQNQSAHTELMTSQSV